MRCGGSVNHTKSVCVPFGIAIAGMFSLLWEKDGLEWVVYPDKEEAHLNPPFDSGGISWPIAVISWYNSVFGIESRSDFARTWPVTH
ncbi:unnamed protein product [Haemonchus placei]|uniref:Secreted protein n=1 Tax=Haemonchus placei TaxID=6290 RepID=A0A0N4WMR3_HAEPC|nr:unnamed protein product [Haemonchus placei]